ncbi:MAG: dihydropteroate synthase [Ignavibacteriae bacterium]|nr:dihydropteroate synthase [Ignavibacteriota bacterium]
MIDFYDYLLSSKIPLVMGIVNVTPDSFSDGGKYFDKNSAVNHALNLIELGADIIDIGGESTRPGAKIISTNEELIRAIPVIEEIRKIDKNIFISIDTTKSEVAKEAINCGVNLVNDISAGSFDPRIFEVVKESEIPYVLMHMKGKPQNMQNEPFYNNVVGEVYDFLKEKIIELNSKGIKKIIIDPGIGFGKRIEDNFDILKNLNKFLNLNKPILVGISKKSFLGKSLNVDIDSRENSTIISETFSVIKGAKIIRTHNVKNAVELKTIFNYLENPKQLTNV